MTVEVALGAEHAEDLCATGAAWAGSYCSHPLFAALCAGPRAAAAGTRAARRK